MFIKFLKFCYFSKYSRLSWSNSLPNDNILDQSKLNGFQDEKIIVTHKLKFILWKVENIVGKEENAGDQHFFLFRQCFQKSPFIGSLKVLIVS